jgi:hypothetical protein
MKREASFPGPIVSVIGFNVLSQEAFGECLISQQL